MSAAWRSFFANHDLQYLNEPLRLFPACDVCILSPEQRNCARSSPRMAEDTGRFRDKAQDLEGMCRNSQ